ncbi:MAG: energy transducer TonB, partial [Flavobacteriales bacterium]
NMMFLVLFILFDKTILAQKRTSKQDQTPLKDSPAQFGWGRYSIDSLVFKNAVLPPMAIFNNLAQDVSVRVEIDSMGNMTKAEIADTSLSMFHEEALRLAYLAQPWKPAIQNQKAVCSFDTIVIPLYKYAIRPEVAVKHTIESKEWRSGSKVPDGSGVIFGTCESKKHSWESATNGDQFVTMFNLDSAKLCRIRVLENSIHKTGNFYYTLPAGRYRLITYSYFAHFGYLNTGYITELLAKNNVTQNLDSLYGPGKELFSDFSLYDIEIKAGEFTYVGYWNFFGTVVQFKNDLEVFRSKNLDQRKRKSLERMKSVCIPK